MGKGNRRSSEAEPAFEISTQIWSRKHCPPNKNLSLHSSGKTEHGAGRMAQPVKTRHHGGATTGLPFLAGQERHDGKLQAELVTVTTQDHTLPYQDSP